MDMISVADPVASRADNLRRTLRSSCVSEDIPDPLFILAAPRSFSSVMCAMLGQHPQMYGLPETHLFGDETMDKWWERWSGESYPMAHGLLRAVAQLCFGEQTEITVKLAAGWLRRRSILTSGMLFEELAREVCPSILVDKSPSLVYSLDSMRRAHRFFPQARFIHLVRHPRGHGESVLKYSEQLARPEYRSREREEEPGAIPHWVGHLASYPSSLPGRDGDPDRDPQRGWYALNMNILMFLKSIPRQQWMMILGEALLTDPDRELRHVAHWMGLREDNDAIEEMKHPERSPYACFGPPRARCGNDVFFLESPALRPTRAKPLSLDGPLAWRPDGHGFLPEVKELAKILGYR